MTTPPPFDPRLPDFLCVGTQRAGTTWLHNALHQDPSFWVPPSKEINYFRPEPDRWMEALRLQMFHQHFSQMLRRGAVNPQSLRWWSSLCLTEERTLRWYRQVFAPAGPRCTGDISPSYFLLDDDAVAAVARVLPQARVFLLLRDPLDRAVSAWRFRVSKGMWSEELTGDALAQALTTGSDLRFADYAAAVTRWERHFPGRCRVFFYEGLVASPQRHLAAITHFLRRPATMIPSRERANTTRGPGVRLPPEVAAAIAPVLKEMLGDLPARFPDPIAGWVERLARAADGEP